MAKLPNVLDYGGRESLRSGRLDMPGKEGQILADAVSNAANTVVSLVDQKMDRDNRLQFALTKDALTKADIAAREALKDRRDFENFDEDYQKAYQESADKILSEHKLTKSDRALATAESDLTRAQGRIYAGDLARIYRHDKERADINQILLDGLEEIALSPPELQNKIMENKLDAIMAGVTTGAYTEEQALAKAQAFATAAATQSLEVMDPEIRLAELELTKAHRKARGPITREEIFEGGGSGSIGDFLTLHEIQDMIDDTEKEIEIEVTQGLAFAASDAAWLEFPDPSQTAERRTFIAEFEDIAENPDARKEALILSGQRASSIEAGKGLKRANASRTLANAIFEGTIDENGLPRAYAISELDAALLASLNRAEQQAIRKMANRRADGFEWAETTSWEARNLWDNMTPSQKAATDFDGFMRADQDAPMEPGENAIHWRSVVDVDRAEYMSADQGQSKKGLAGSGYNGLSQTQVLTDTLIASDFFEKKPGNSKGEQGDRERWARISDAYNRALISADKAGRHIDDEAALEILGKVMTHEVFTTKGMPDKRRLFAGVPVELYEEAYIPLNEKVMLGGERTTIYNRIPVPDKYGGDGKSYIAYKWIKDTMTSFTGEPSQRDIEEAWFYLVTQGWDAAYGRMVGKIDPRTDEPY
jgi:hypothetical protein